MNCIVNDNGEKLCLSCGLCCTGAFHTMLKIIDNVDKQVALDFGAELMEYDQLLWSRLPCPVFDEKCTIFPERPLICEKHQCDLLKSLLCQDITFGKALSLVKKMKSLFFRLDQQLNAIVGKEETKEIELRFYRFYKRYEKERDTDEFRKKHAQLTKNYTLFYFLKKKYFYLDNNDAIKR